MVGTSQQGDRWWLELTQQPCQIDTCRHAGAGADRSTLIKAQLSAHNVRAYRKRGTG